MKRLDEHSQGLLFYGIHNYAEQWSVQQGLTRLQLLTDKRNSAALDFYNAHQWQETQLIALRKFL